ncbi:Protein suppressor of white apricot [Smittium culicis]|uniref:Protein suppressor of white apricot n=1 Tax=Smittium culicis TaxID=133412 RepID=A0A1R1YA50_9FUNG|nr:Protein suppressor of white apricot [Smittium culicis]
MDTFSNSDFDESESSSNDEYSENETASYNNRKPNNSAFENDFGRQILKRDMDSRNEYSGLENQFLCFGYEAKLFPISRNELHKFETEKYLVPWYDYEYSSHPLVDRFDVRNLISEEKYTKILKRTSNMNKRHWEGDNHSVPEGSKDGITSTINSNESSDKKLTKADSSSPSEKTSEIVAEKSSTKAEGDDSFTLNFSIPNDIIPPKTRKDFEIMEKTAKFICCKETGSEQSQMEIKLMVKQSSNPVFGFLSKSNELHRFYIHLKYLIQMGLYGYESQSDSDDDVDPSQPTTAPLPSPPQPSTSQSSVSKLAAEISGSKVYEDKSGAGTSDLSNNSRKELGSTLNNKSVDKLELDIKKKVEVSEIQFVKLPSHIK